MKPPARPCIVSRCPYYNLTGGSRCPAHESEFEAKRKTWSTGRRGTSAAWRRVRSQVLARDQACVACGAKDDLEVHHIGSVDDNSQGNLTALCRTCHRVVHHGH